MGLSQKRPISSSHAAATLPHVHTRSRARRRLAAGAGAASGLAAAADRGTEARGWDRGPLNTVSGETDATRRAQRRTRSVALFDRRMLRRRHRERRPCNERTGVRVFDARTPRRVGSREASQVRQCGLRHEKTRQADATRVRSGLHPKAASEMAKSPRTRYFGRRSTGACYSSEAGASPAIASEP